MDMDRRLGPWRLRLWGLIANFFGNILALFGIVRVVRDGSWGLLVAGGSITLVCVALLSIPARGQVRGEEG